VRRVFGPRSVVEAVFLVAVPVAALALGYGGWAIIGASAVGYLLVLVLEAGLWQMRSVPAAALSRRWAADVSAKPPSVSSPDPPMGEEPEPEREPEPEPVRVLQPVPDAEPEPEPEPEPELVVAEPAPAASVVVPIGVGSTPRRWNLWDLERLVRESPGSDSIVDDERSYLLMYLREFAGPDGSLPVDFDALVRDSFGELVGARQ
jgi:hypothetical protein